MQDERNHLGLNGQPPMEATTETPLDRKVPRATILCHAKFVGRDNPYPKGRRGPRTPSEAANGRGSEHPWPIGRDVRDFGARRARPASRRPGHGGARGTGAGHRVRVADGVAAVAGLRDVVVHGPAAVRGDGASGTSMAGGDDRRPGEGARSSTVDVDPAAGAGRPGGAGGDGRGDLPGQGEGQPGPAVGDRAVRRRDRPGEARARLVPVFGMLLCATPVLAMEALFGGVDPVWIIGAFFVVLSCAVFGCSLALTLSVWGKKTHEVLMATYLFGILYLLATPICRGPPAMSPRRGGQWGCPRSGTSPDTTRSSCSGGVQWAAPPVVPVTIETYATFLGMGLGASRG